MVKAVSTYVFVRQRLHPGLLEGLRLAGAEAIEIFACRGHFDFYNPQQAREMAGWFKSSGVAFHSMHSPMFYEMEWGGNMTPVNITETDRKRRIEAMDEIKRALETAEHAPFKFLVQHLGNSNEEMDERKFEAAMTSVEHLRAFAKPLGVTLLLENIPNEISAPEKLNELVHTGHFDDVGFCFDVGHANMVGAVRTAFDQMQERVRSTHIHDNRREKDDHLLVGEGNIDWAEFAGLLAAAPHVPPFLLELDGLGELEPNAKVRKSFEFFENVRAAAAKQG
jgi:sugar phosphate isomerase/epimerase